MSQTTRKITKTSQVLRGAIEMIKRHGYCKGQMLANDGSMCGYGAMSFYMHAQKFDRDLFFDAESEMTKDIHRLTDFNYISAFNDAGETTRTDVLRMMGTTARRLEKEGR